MLILNAIKLSSEASVNKIYIGERVRRLTDRSNIDELLRTSTIIDEHLRDVEKKTKQMCPNQLRVIFIFLITPATALQFAGYPCTTGTQKPPKISSKNSSFNWVHSIIMRSMNASHSTFFLFTNSCHHISTNGKAPPHSHINLQHPTNSSIRFYEELMLETSAF